MKACAPVLCDRGERTNRVATSLDIVSGLTGVQVLAWCKDMQKWKEWDVQSKVVHSIMLTDNKNMESKANILV